MHFTTATQGIYILSSFPVGPISDWQAYKGTWIYWKYEGVDQRHLFIGTTEQFIPKYSRRNEKQTVQLGRSLTAFVSLCIHIHLACKPCWTANFTFRKFHTVNNWYQFFTAREELVPIRHIFHTNISHFVKFAHVVKIYVAYMRNLHIDKKHPKSAAFCNRLYVRIL